LLAIAVALYSPLDDLAAQYFAAHMAQHLLMTQIAAPLLSLGAPLVPILWALPDGVQRLFGRFVARESYAMWLGRQLTRPPIAFVFHTATIWFWHVPANYEAALLSPLVHDVQHISLMLTALLFWWPVIHPIPGRPGLAHGARLVYVGVAMIVQTKVLGALLTFSAAPVYRVYVERWPGFGIDPLTDQELAGLQMLVGSAILMMIAGTSVFVAWAKKEAT
jgi:putative membrane protein